MAKRTQVSRSAEWTLMKLPVCGYGRHRLDGCRCFPLAIRAVYNEAIAREYSAICKTRTPERNCMHFTRRSIQDDFARHWGRHGTHEPVRKRKDGRQEMQMLMQRRVPRWHTRPPSLHASRLTVDERS